MRASTIPFCSATLLLALVGCEPSSQAQYEEAGVVLPAATSPPAGDGIERMATLGTPRAAHTTTALRSGQLLVAGGMGSGGRSLSTVELIDVSTASVEPVASMTDARAGHTATALPDGRVVLAGGYNGAYLRSVEVFDPARQRFEAMGRLNEGRSGHTATLLPGGQILLAGGVGRGWSFLSSAEVFDPATGRSEAIEPLSVPREGHTATLLTDGRVLVVGGHRGRREAMEVYASAELYYPATRRFQSAGRLTTARHKHDAVLLADGRVLVLGGADRTDRRYYATTEVYNPASTSFEPGPPMTTARYKIQGTSIRLTSGDVLVPSGARTAELLDSRSFTFRSVTGGFPAAYFYATATPLSTGDVVIVGGMMLRTRTQGAYGASTRARWTAPPDQRLQLTVRLSPSGNLPVISQPPGRPAGPGRGVLVEGYRCLGKARSDILG